MKSEWLHQSLGDICHVYQPETISQKQMIAGAHPVYGANGQIGWHNRFNHEEPQLILGCRGSCGTVHTTQAKSWINGNAMVVQPRNGAVNLAFLAYALKGGIEVSGSITGAAQPQITRTSLMPLAISYPKSIREQQRIVAILDEAFAGITTAKANVEKSLQNARGLFQSHLQLVFTQRAGWETKTVDQVSVNLDSKRVPITKSDRKAGEFPYYGASGIVDYVADYIFEGDTLLVSEDGANLLARSTPIAFPASGKYWVNNHAHILKFESMTTQRYVELYLASIPLDEYITGAAQPKLNQKALNSIQIPIPTSVEAQAKVVASIESVQVETQRLESLYQRKLAALDALKQSLLHQAFSGQL